MSHDTTSAPQTTAIRLGPSRGPLPRRWRELMFCVSMEPLDHKAQRRPTPSLGVAHARTLSLIDALALPFAPTRACAQHDLLCRATCMLSATPRSTRPWGAPRCRARAPHPLVA